MRHGKKILKIGRTASHRKATLQSMSAALIQHKRITTTLGKARALRVYVEPILNRAKDDSTASRREAFRHLQNKEAIKELYGSIASAIGSRPGGYTRIVKLGQRGGDAAEMAVVEIVDFNDVKPTGSAGTKRKTRRSRTARGTADAAPAAAAPVGAAEETPAAETEAVDAAETTDTESDADQTTNEAPVDPAAEAVHSDNPDPDTTGNPQVPTGPSGGSNPDSAPGDAEQGAPSGTGDPNPESHPTNLGRSGHRG